MKESHEIAQSKESLFIAVRKYQSLYPKLTKEFCKKLWGSLEKEKEWGELFFKRVLGALKAHGFSDLELLSKEPEEVTLRKMKAVIKKIFERMASKGNSAHKLQAVFSSLNFQRQFAPGGFRRSSQFETHIASFEKDLEKFTRDSLALHPSHVVFSNEAFSEKRYPKDKEIETLILEGSQRENNAASFLKAKEKKNVERVLLGENYFLKVEDASHTAFTAHFSSIKEEEREEKSQFFCEKRLPFLLKDLEAQAKGKKFSFAGDINLYFFTDSKEGRNLRPEVAKILKDYQLVMIVPSGLVNKNIRPEIHEQWHKLKENSGLKVEAYPDSMVVLEPYRDDFDYKTLRNNGLGASQDIFFPNGSSLTSPEASVKEPFSSGFMMDHIPVRGCFVSILNGADGDGTGNSSKAFLELAALESPSEESFLKHLEAMRVNLESTSQFIRELS